MSGAIRFTRWCVGECAWVALAVVLSIAFVAGFVWLAEPHAADFWSQLRSPVNVVRIVVLSAAIWIWAYIGRVIRTSSRNAVPRTPRAAPSHAAAPRASGLL
jgi:hypothetical protein